jgi:Animal haem peroxidase
MTPRTVLVSSAATDGAAVLHGYARSSAGDAGDVGRIREMARELIARGEPAMLAFAEARLQEAVAHGDESGETRQLLGLAQFLQKKYGDARANLEVAVATNPGIADWTLLLERATRNALTNLQRAPEPTEAFDPVALTAPPAHYMRVPQGIVRPPDPNPVTRVVAFLRDVAGAVLGVALGVLVKYEGRKGVEQTWKEWPLLAGPLADLRRDVKIAGIRKWMNHWTLKSTEEPGTLVNNQQPGQTRPEWTSYVRTANGSWNTDDPAEGMAGARVSWQGKDSLASIRRDRSLDADLPSVRELSRAFLASPGGPRATAPFLNNVAIAWIQFMLHDWINHRQQSLSTAESIKVELAEDDPLRSRYGQDALIFPRTQPDPMPTPGMLTYRNEVTAWWDGSQIYGSDQATQDQVRTGADGRLLADGKLRLDDGLLPVDEKGRQFSGFTRNWWVGLSMLHTLFVKHHNHVCDVLKATYPQWSSDQLFNKARLINAAIMAKIHTIEWTPAVLPTKTLAVGMNANWNGLIDAMVRRFKDRKAINAYDVTEPVLGGLVGGRRVGYGVPYNFGEQFSEVYRLHAAVPQDLAIRRIGSADVVATVQVDASREQAAQKIQREYGMATLINSLGFEPMAALVNNNYPRFLTEMSTEGSPVMDLGAADLLRARERGVPPYNEFRRQLGLPPIGAFEDLGVDEETVGKLKAFYGDAPEGVEKLDLLIGTLCERDRPLRGFGQTLFAVFLQAASGRLERDPWFCEERFNDRYYTREGMDLIDNANLKDLFILHYPELKTSGLADVNNAFEPWRSTAATAPDEHPLTATGAERY